MRKWAVLVTLVLVISGRAVAAEDYSQEGRDAYDKGQYDEAIRCYTLYLSSNPNDADAYKNRGNAYLGKGNYDPAIADYTKAIQLKPDDADFYFNRGLAYDGKGECDLAIADYNKTIQLKPDHAKAYNSRGLAYDGKGEYDLAIADCTKGIQLKPDYAEAYNIRGIAYLGKGDYDPAIADCTKALELSPNNGAVLDLRGVAYHALGKDDLALLDWRKANEINPRFPTSPVSRKMLNVAPSGMTFLRTNRQGYQEFLWLKDSSVMVKVPAGTFTMGSNDGYDYEKPAHQVYLDEYYMDKYEATNRQYKRFCDATGRSYPDDPGWKGMSGYFTSYPTYPVVNVTWEDAKAYCDWAGKRLPTEAEWEKAARGTDSRKYPWGSGVPTGSPCNFADRNTSYGEKNTDDGYARTAPVGSFPAGASPYGCLDMAGNVWEWCNDWYGENYYSSGAGNNPQGPASGSLRVHRGGSWDSDAADLRCSRRFGNRPLARGYFLGFRCAGVR